MTTLPDAAAKTITEFRQAVASRKIQQPNKYKVFIQDGSQNSLVCYPESVTLPQRSFNTAPYTPWGPMLQLPVRREYGECAMSFIIYQDWAERRYFERWMDTIIPRQASASADPVGVSYTERILGPSLGSIFTGTGSRRISTSQYTDYSTAFNSITGNIQIFPLTIDSNKSDGGTMSCSINLIDAFPLTITPTQLSSESTGYTTFVVIFAFREYEFM